MDPRERPWYGVILSITTYVDILQKCKHRKMAHRERPWYRVILSKTTYVDILQKCKHMKMAPRESTLVKSYPVYKYSR